MEGRTVATRLVSASLAGLLVGAFMAVLPPHTAAQAARAPARPAGPVQRLPDGKPDLTGVWTPRGPGGEIERTSLAKLESLYTPAALREMGDLGESDDPLLRCIPYGVPRATASSPWPFQIVQHPGYVVVLTEYYHSFRIIPYGDGLRHSEDIIPTYFGDSVARWDGDTLVVDVTGLNAQTWLADGRDKPTPTSKGRWPHSDALHVTERWRAVDGDTIEYQAVVEDPKMLSGPWTTPLITARRTPVQKIGEGICSDSFTYTLAASGKDKDKK
jgi:hypothetical protein